MKNSTLAGIVLIIIGIATFAFEGITYTTHDKAVDIGPIQVTTENTREIPLPPIFGACALMGGIVILVLSNRKS